MDIFIFDGAVLRDHFNYSLLCHLESILMFWPYKCFLKYFVLHLMKSFIMFFIIFVSAQALKINTEPNNVGKLKQEEIYSDDHHTLS